MDVYFNELFHPFNEKGMGMPFFAGNRLAFPVFTLSLQPNR